MTIEQAGISFRAPAFRFNCGAHFAGTAKNSAIRRYSVSRVTPSARSLRWSSGVTCAFAFPLPWKQDDNIRRNVHVRRATAKK